MTTEMADRIEDGGPVVKALEWGLVTPPDGIDVEARTPFGVFVISVDSELVGKTHYLWVAGQSEDEDYHSAHRTMADAKTTAQANFERRILSALVPTRARQIGLSVGSAEA